MSFIKPTLLLAAMFGCASAKPAPNSQAQQSQSPLAEIVGKQLVVLPAQLLSTAGPAGTWDVRQDEDQLLSLLDQEMTDAFRKRGVRGNWVFPRDLIASATRNAGLAGNPLSLTVAGIRRWKAGDTPLPEPLASEIRTLVALTNARFVLLPLETRVDISGGQRKGSLRVLLVDARTARIQWVGDVETQSLRDPVIVAETMSPYGFRLLARELADLFANMVVAP